MFTNSHEIEIEWGHCDPAGIVFFPRYFEMFDAATARLLEAALGLKKINWMQQFEIIGIPMVELRTQFLAPCRFGDVVTIESAITKTGRSSIKIHHRLIGPAGLAVEAREIRVWTGSDPTNSEKLISAPLPDDVISALNRTRKA